MRSDNRLQGSVDPSVCIRECVCVYVRARGKIKSKALFVFHSHTIVTAILVAATAASQVRQNAECLEFVF